MGNKGKKIKDSEEETKTQERNERREDVNSNEGELSLAQEGKHVSPAEGWLVVPLTPSRP